jgi:site-specific DNA-methyltransferase (adenine-specific)
MKAIEKYNVVFNQDCYEGMKNIPGNAVDLVVTSPPYDNLRTYNDSSSWNFDVFTHIAGELYRVTKNGGVVVWIVNDATIKGCETGTSFRQALYFREIGFLLHDTMIWQKISPFQHKNRYIQSFEYMFVLSKNIPPKTANLICDRQNKWGGTKVHGTDRMTDGQTKPFSQTQKSKVIKEYGARYNIWDIPPNKHNTTGHPAVFPEQLATDHILTWSNAGDVVLDPFMGSGTTILSAIKNNRQ